MQSELVQKTAAAAIARNAEKTAQAKHADAEHKVSSQCHHSEVPHCKLRHHYPTDLTNP